MTRRIIAVLVMLLVIAGCADTSSDKGTAAPVPTWSVDCGTGTPAVDFPAMELPCLGADGSRPVGPASSGRPILVTLWASWCRPCVAEAPEIVQFHSLFEGTIDVLGVNTQDTADAGRFFAEDLGLTFPSVVDDRGDVLRSQGIATLPASFLVDESGTVVARFTEAGLTTEALTEAAELHLGLTP